MDIIIFAQWLNVWNEKWIKPLTVTPATMADRSTRGWKKIKKEKKM